MPMMTQFIRGEDLVPLRWGWWHINCFSTAYTVETQLENLADLTEYTYVGRHVFVDPDDGEILTIEPGDSFRWWRD